MALIFDIKRYAIHDGPGIRTTLFVKGCPLRCVWCHNPESWSPAPQRLYKKSKCIGCGSCVQACPEAALELTSEGIRPTGRNCMLCGACAAACPALAMEICGKEWGLEALMDQVECERAVMEGSGGGVTLSGGEPLMQAEFTLSLLRELGHRGFHRAVDTTLFASVETVEAVAGECELFMVDVKTMDTVLHKRYTGVPNEPILANLRRVAALGIPYWVRIPLICEVNASEENIQAVVRFLCSLDRPPQVLDLLPYHDIGKGKHERLGTLYNPDGLSLSAPSAALTNRCVSLLSAAGLNVRVGG